MFLDVLILLNLESFVAIGVCLQASRLHFIGTWRNRYQSRYGSSNQNEKNDDHEHQSFRANSGGDPAIIHIDMVLTQVLTFINLYHIVSFCRRESLDLK